MARAQVQRADAGVGELVPGSQHRGAVRPAPGFQHFRPVGAGAHVADSPRTVTRAPPAVSSAREEEGLADPSAAKCAACTSG